jgi:cytoskeletal protein CcmA (bactofilin family)
MGFFSDLKEDLSQAVNELLPDESKTGAKESRYKTLAEFQEDPDFSKLMVFPNEEENKKSLEFSKNRTGEGKSGSRLEFSIEAAPPWRSEPETAPYWRTDMQTEQKLSMFETEAPAKSAAVVNPAAAVNPAAVVNPATAVNPAIVVNPAELAETVAVMEAEAGVQTEPLVSQAAFAIEPEATIAIEPEATIAIEPEATIAIEPEVAITIEPETTIAIEPEVAIAIEPEVAIAIEPEAAFAIEPETAFAIEPEAVFTIEPEATIAIEPEASITDESVTAFHTEGYEDVVTVWDTEPMSELALDESSEIENTTFAYREAEEGRKKEMNLDEMLNDALAGGRLGGETAEEQTDRVGEILDETAIITGGMTLTGDVDSQGSMNVEGMINGNLDILGKLVVTGCINGNSRAAEIYADGAKINGEVISEGTVKIGASSVIIGNITAKSAVVAGAVKGDIDVMGPVILDTSAIVMGNIKSKSVQINNGAVIEGMCSQCYADVNPTSFFDEYKPEIKKVKLRKD